MKLADDGGAPTVELPKGVEVVPPAGDPYAQTDEALVVTVPEDVPTAASPKSAVAPVQAPDGARPRVRELWDEYANVRALDADAHAIYFADMMGQDGKVISKIRAVPLDGGDVEVVVPDLGRVDAISVDGGELAWVALPTDEEGPPALWVRPLGSDDNGEARLVDPNYGTANHLARVGDSYVFVLPVTQQGRSGGVAQIGAHGGARKGIGKALGPAFKPVASGDRVYFMAHQRGGPDVIYSVDAAGTEVEAHVSMPRGVFALAVDDSHIYWAKIGEGGRSTELGSVPKDASAAPRALGTIDGEVFESMVVAGGALWLGSSPASSSGRVVKVPTKGIAAGAPPRVVYEAPRIWDVFTAPAGGERKGERAQGRRVLVELERPGDGGTAHRVFIELEPR